MRAASLRAPDARVRVLRGLVLIVFLVLGARAAQLALLPERPELGARQVESVLTLPPTRGAILDRAGSALAVTVEAPSVYVDPTAIENPATTTRALARALGIPVDRVAARLATRGRFAFVARWVTAEAAARVEALELPGVGVVDETRRAYPSGPLAASVVGFANIDGRGVRGAEQQEDAWLRGRARRLAVERDARGRLLVRSVEGALDTRGGDVALTLDAALQAEAERALRDAVAKHRARGGVIVTLDPKTGDILALAEAPGFDPNRFRDVPYPETRSRAFLDAVEPGSTLKSFLVAAALDAGVIHSDDSLDCENGRYRVPGKTIRDTHKHGLLSLAGVLRVSSNVCSVKIAQALGAEEHHAWLRAFGFGSRSASGFPNESAGLLRPWRRWKPVDHATIAFGQGIAVTPIQLAAATAVLAGDGHYRTPRLVAARRPAGGDWKPVEAAPARAVLRPETARRVLVMLEGVVGPDGTGGQAGLRALRVAGKTGTAQKLDRETGRYSNDRYTAWFTGIAPADEPRLVVVVGIDEPSGPVHSGGAVVAPVFARTAAAQLAHFGIMTRPEPSVARRPPARPAPKPASRPAPTVARRAGTLAATVSRSAAPPTRASDPEEPTPVVSAPPPRPAAVSEPIARVGDRVLLPDFRGLSVSEVRALAEANSLMIEIEGRGRAVSQEPEPGAILAAGAASVRIRFAPGAEES
ncbi:MAG: transpeptidase family protein [Proteobacteria bacterium]|nr:transpeptidase family protein [Pseudomonadota bacterium]